MEGLGLGLITVCCIIIVIMIGVVIENFKNDTRVDTKKENEAAALMLINSVEYHKIKDKDLEGFIAFRLRHLSKRRVRKIKKLYEGYKKSNREATQA